MTTELTTNDGNNFAEKSGEVNLGFKKALTLHSIKEQISPGKNTEAN